MTKVHKTYQYMVCAVVTILAVVALILSGFSTAYAQEQNNETSVPEEEKISVPILDKEVLNLDNEWVHCRSALTTEDVQFRITVTLGEHMDKQETYNVTVVDERPQGLDVDLSTLTVILDGKPIKFEVTEKDNTFSIDVGDLKALGATTTSVVEIIYHANIADGGAQAGFPGYVNRAYAVYPKGKTEKAEASVVTFAVTIDKTDKSMTKALSGAKFAIRNEDGLILHKDGTWSTDYSADTCLFETDSRGVCEMKGLAEGKYEIVEAVAPDGYTRSNVMIGLELVADLSKKSVTVSALHDLLGSVSADSSTGNTTLQFCNEEGPDNPEPDKPFDNSSTPELGKTGYQFPWMVWVIAFGFLTLGVVGLVSDRTQRKREYHS